MSPTLEPECRKINMAPFFSIITATYNAAATLPRLLDSLVFQTCRDFNWIVQDGASSDGTMAVVERYADRLPEILAESCKDEGIYDAWNKALDRQQQKLGQWILFLGADDALTKESILHDAKKFLHASSEKILFGAGKLLLFDPEKHAYEYMPQIDPVKNFSERFSDMPLKHSALFHRSILFTTYRFDATFKIAGDYDFILRVWKSPEQILPLDILVTQMALGGISTSASTTSLRFPEKYRAIRKNFSFEKGNSFKSIKTLYTAYIISIKLFIKKTICSSEKGRDIWKKIRIARGKDPQFF